jgi:hypothetical protein
VADGTTTLVVRRPTAAERELMKIRAVSADAAFVLRKTSPD